MMIRPTNLLCAGLMLGLIACADETPTPDRSDTGAPESTSAGAVTPIDTARTMELWNVTATGAGPVRYGMTAAEASAILGGSRIEGDTAGGCYYIRGPKAPELAVMIVGGHVARVDVETGSAQTDAGGRIGDTEERIKSLYPNVLVEPHKYTDGHYLVVTPDDSTKRIIFETDGKRVVNFRGGRTPEVFWVEGCS